MIAAHATTPSVSCLTSQSSPTVLRLTRFSGIPLMAAAPNSEILKILKKRFRIAGGKITAIVTHPYNRYIPENETIVLL